MEQYGEPSITGTARAPKNKMSEIHGEGKKETANGIVVGCGEKIKREQRTKKEKRKNRRRTEEERKKSERTQ